MEAMARNEDERPDSEEPADEPAIDEETEEHFVRGLIARGEAAKPDKDGKLPPHATHEIVEEREGELPKVRRRRYSMF